MATTTLVPKWGSKRVHEWIYDAVVVGIITDEVSVRCELQHDKVLDYKVIEIPDRTDNGIPARFTKIPLEHIIITQHNSPWRNIPDGHYIEWVESRRVDARVTSMVRHGALIQSIRVAIKSSCYNNVDNSIVNTWFDALLSGEKNVCCTNPALPPEQPAVVLNKDVVAARNLLESMIHKGFADRDRGEILHDCERLWELLSGHPKLQFEQDPDGRMFIKTDPGELMQKAMALLQPPRIIAAGLEVKPAEVHRATMHPTRRHRNVPPRDVRFPDDPDPYSSG